MHHPNRSCCDFARVYELGRSTELRALERSVLGSDYGATSWTTRREASQIAELLDLQPSARLLDVGAGSGWPGIYLAQAMGCNVTLVDLPLVGLQLALERAAADGLRQRCHAVLADGARLPFREGSFDALSHSDVLCCMRAKLSLLQACRRVARTGAKMAFSVIAPAVSLSESERQIAIESGPPFVDVVSDYANFLDQTGWLLMKRCDVTDEFSQSLCTYLEIMNARTHALTAVLGPDEFAERVQRRQATLAAISGGLLKREIFVAVADR
jgi:cyclopropane fatty-acyl-phospholipid synthase-like methyltransferase